MWCLRNVDPSPDLAEVLSVVEGEVDGNLLFNFLTGFESNGEHEDRESGRKTASS